MHSGEPDKRVRPVNSDWNCCYYQDLYLSQQFFCAWQADFPRNVNKYPVIVLKHWLNWQITRKSWFQMWLMRTRNCHFPLFFSLVKNVKGFKVIRNLSAYNCICCLTIHIEHLHNNSYICMLYFLNNTTNDYL